MRSYLLVAATALEIEPFLEHFRGAGFDRTDITLNVLLTGVGIMPATYHLLNQLKYQRPSLVIQAGVGGCFDNSKELGVVYAIRKDRLADAGVMEKGKFMDLAGMKLEDPDRLPYKNGWLVNEDKILEGIGLPLVDAVTVNQLSDDKNWIDYCAGTYHALMESMEGAVLHYVCLQEKIPFLQLRAASNYVGERNKKKWRMKESIHQLNRELERLLLIL